MEVHPLLCQSIAHHYQMPAPIQPTGVVMDCKSDPTDRMSSKRSLCSIYEGAKMSSHGRMHYAVTDSPRTQASSEGAGTVGGYIPPMMTYRRQHSYGSRHFSGDSIESRESIESMDSTVCSTPPQAVPMPTSIVQSNPRNSSTFLQHWEKSDNTEKVESQFPLLFFPSSVGVPLPLPKQTRHNEMGYLHHHIGSVCTMNMEPPPQWTALQHGSTAAPVSSHSPVEWVVDNNVSAPPVGPCGNPSTRAMANVSLNGCDLRSAVMCPPPAGGQSTFQPQLLNPALASRSEEKVGGQQQFPIMPEVREEGESVGEWDTSADDDEEDDDEDESDAYEDDEAGEECLEVDGPGSKSGWCHQQNRMVPSEQYNQPPMHAPVPMMPAQPRTSGEGGCMVCGVWGAGTPFACAPTVHQHCQHPRRLTQALPSPTTTSRPILSQSAVEQVLSRERFAAANPPLGPSLMLVNALQSIRKRFLAPFPPSQGQVIEHRTFPDPLWSVAT
eukprot:GHVN01055313.1.p1 GENE.GHVN01055313.1~~GHVN01055313.1.p1  ORF type:complete len:497 (+),score=49.88 GHVN01055313.1:344-1834(+)